MAHPRTFLNSTARGIHLSKGTKASAGSAEEAGAFGEAEDIAHSESSERPGQEHRGKDAPESYEGTENGPCGALLAGNDDFSLAGKVSKEAIDALTRQIKAIEGVGEKRMDIRRPYDLRLTLPGVGRVLAVTIMRETGPIERFPEVGNYVSYCREVPAARFSNEEKKGTGNRKNGNQYLSWAYGEAAELARRFDSGARAYYDRKLRKTDAPVAHSALAHKLAGAAYYMMRDGVPFMPEKALV